MTTQDFPDRAEPISKQIRFALKVFEDLEGEPESPAIPCKAFCVLAHRYCDNPAEFAYPSIQAKKAIIDNLLGSGRYDNQWDFYRWKTSCAIAMAFAAAMADDRITMISSLYDVTGGDIRKNPSTIVNVATACMLLGLEGKTEFYDQALADYATAIAKYDFSEQTYYKLTEIHAATPIACWCARPTGSVPIHQFYGGLQRILRKVHPGKFRE